ncbi:cytochrome c3 family protein [Carboxylicivirga marina]|uniref:cytochrome c3 family protein n=1 Tax=Carboxylicivirga marina TaxID=2800988 RepID=UPI00259A1C4A|nr:cytochrome c3 family protein [uncultured Carboxylicivirga sp.]
MVKLFKLLFFSCFTFGVIGCSPENKYKVLSTFFDGVPVPTTGVIKRVDTVHGPSYNELFLNQKRLENMELKRHAPYDAKECNMCHIPNSMGKLIMEQPNLCYQCHENYNDRYKYIHGPVAAGYCNSCHDPHQSRLNNLNTRDGQDLCMYCHIEKDVFGNENHSDIVDFHCTECHNPHGGEERFMFY